MPLLLFYFEDAPCQDWNLFYHDKHYTNYTKDTYQDISFYYYSEFWFDHDSATIDVRIRVDDAWFKWSNSLGRYDAVDESPTHVNKVARFYINSKDVYIIYEIEQCMTCTDSDFFSGKMNTYKKLNSGLIYDLLMTKFQNVDTKDLK